MQSCCRQDDIRCMCGAGVEESSDSPRAWHAVSQHAIVPDVLSPNKVSGDLAWFVKGASSLELGSINLVSRSTRNLIYLVFIYTPLNIISTRTRTQIIYKKPDTFDLCLT